jgi:hypothetical protein
MTPYTFSIESHRLEDERTGVLDLAMDFNAVTAAGAMLDECHESVSVGRDVGDEIEWLGVWDWCEGRRLWRSAVGQPPRAPAVHA